MKKILLFSLLAMILSGCGAPEEGYYIVDKVDVSIHEKDDPPHVTEIKQAISDKISDFKDDIYFYLTPTEISHFISITPEKVDIKENKIKFGGNTFHLKKTFSGAELSTDTEGHCGFYKCQLTLNLKQVNPDNPKLIDIQNRFKAIDIKMKKFYDSQEKKLNELGFNDFPGELIYEDKLSIKLPPAELASFEKVISGIYYRNIGELYIDRKNENSNIYHFKNETTQLYSDLFIIKAPKDKFDYSSWLKIQDKVLYNDEHGAVYYNMYGNLEAFYYQYDDESQQYFIGLANAPNLGTIRDAYVMLRTMNPQYQGELSNMQDMSLSQSEFEAKYRLKIADYFDKDKILKSLITEMNLDAPQPGAKKRASFNAIRVKFPSNTLGAKIYYYFHKKTMGDIIAEFKRKNPQGKWINKHVFVYSISPSDASGYSYFIDHNGLIYEIFVSTDIYGDVARMTFHYVLQQLDPAKLTVPPPAEKTHEKNKK
ncbi:hypothetical protein FE392_06155 [Xenorhabdus sp. 12]|uniref:Lipoprotein n=1 Tax=Xenorhabdus santafensis TaxID=2582833 RepID=A0ABU4S805_9GAMM|nr:hypothetical protein [Xenorhabdus sp. 12]MDX7986914.1 hypothetical protein [Xenorhabdus sp. 12]